MNLVGQLQVERVRGERPPAVIQLLQGDLAAIPEEHAVDALVVSAFPDNYDPVPGTLFASLRERGLDMREVAEHKEEDERERLGCWLSQSLPRQLAARFHFDRIVCFEPRHPAFVRHSGIREETIEDSVAFVFRCLNNFIIPDKDSERDFHIARVAMPILATGNQRVPVEAVFPRLLDAAVFWLEQGLPIQQLKIVVFRPEYVGIAKRLFERVTPRYEQRQTTRQPSPPPADADWRTQLAHTLATGVIGACEARLKEDLLAAARDHERPIVEAVLSRLEAEAESSAATRVAAPPAASEYDVFISYAHTHEEQVKAFVAALRQHAPTTRIFFDRQSIPAGGQWIKMLSDAVGKARTFVALLSPEYTASPVCWDEFQCAKLKEYTTRQSVIKTVRLFSEPSLPPIMGIYSYIDCAEGDLQKLQASASAIVQAGP